jgi:hypothetical protein
VTRRRSASTLATVAACVLALAAGCGGAAPERQPAASPADAPAAAPGAHAAPTTTEPSGPGAPPPAPPPPPPPAPASAFTPEEPRDREARRDSARKELETAEKQLLDVAASSCESACRALASMERATSLLCTVADDAGDQRRCEDARRRLSAARTHVRSVCGSCS